MIKYNLNTINDWNFGDDNIIKVYRHNAVCYYKVSGGGDTPTAQTPCYAVVNYISQLSDTEFDDVYETSSEKWYKLNNLDEYEEYGIYGSGRNISYYDGKLTIDDGYEYQYSGGSWVNVGEVSGGTASLPDIPFSVNFNAKNYDSNSKTLLKTSGQLVDVDAVITAGTPTVNDGYLTILSGTRATIEGYSAYFNRDNSNPNLTIISKQNTNRSYCHMFANRDGNYNWMYRCYSDKLTLHGGSETGGVAVTTQPVVESVRVDSSRNITYNNYTNNTTSGTTEFNYGATNSGKFALFAGYGTSTGEWFVGDFYWVYMSQNTLTDEQVQQVIDYNEGGSPVVYPVYYDEIQDPPNYLSFSSMTEAEEYECPWVGMNATIDGDRYVFSGNSISGYEWVYIPSRLPSGYTEVEYIENTTTGTNYYIDTQFKPNQDTRVILEAQASVLDSNPRMFGSGPWNGLAFVANIENVNPQKYFFKYGQTSSWWETDVTADTNKHTFDLNKNSYYIDNVLANTASTSTFQLTTNLGIFNAPSTSSFQDSETFIGKVFSCKIYDNGTLIRDLVPCYRDSDSKSGLYDIVNDVFYTAVNTSYNFTVGPPV